MSEVPVYELHTNRHEVRACHDVGHVMAQGTQPHNPRKTTLTAIVQLDTIAERALAVTKTGYVDGHPLSSEYGTYDSQVQMSFR